MSERRVDFAILGGGCAGLSLAVALRDAGLGDRRLVVVEPRESFPRDRTWCYWDVAEHPFEDAVAHSWSRWKLRHGGREIVHRSSRHRYCEVPADAFYRAALARLRGAELQLGTRAVSVEDGPDGVTVTTDRDRFRADVVFDGRPPPRRVDPGGLVQHFVGLHVQTDQAAFSPDTLTLMDFDVRQDLGIHFFYVLPYTRDRALVEATFVSPQPLPEARYLEAIDRYLATRYDVHGYKTEDRERGVIPMSARPASLRPSPNVYRIGTAGGLVKPSTGYAFLAIQRWTRELARRLFREARPTPPPVRAPLVRRLDAIFLAFLRRHPERAPELFTRLFDRVSPDALVHFLTDSATGFERLQVVSAMPTLPFLREAWRSRREWLRC